MAPRCPELTFCQSQYNAFLETRKRLYWASSISLQTVIACQPVKLSRMSQRKLLDSLSGRIGWVDLSVDTRTSSMLVFYVPLTACVSPSPGRRWADPGQYLGTPTPEFAELT